MKNILCHCVRMWRVLTNPVTYAWLQQKHRFIIPEIHLYGRTQLALQALITVQTIIHHHSMVFTTGQDSVNPEHYVMAAGKYCINCMALILALCCSKSIKPTNHFNTLFIT